MDPTEISPDDKNIFGDIDRLIVNASIFTLALIPTTLTLVFKPWKMVPQLEEHEADGRNGFLLGPGIFMVLSLLLTGLITLVFAQFPNAPEAFEDGGASDLQDALSSGNPWQVIGLVVPTVGVALGLATLSIAVFRLYTRAWTAQIAVRAALYVISTITMVLTPAIIPLAVFGDNSTGLTAATVIISILVILIIPTWQYTHFLRKISDKGWISSAILSGLNVITALSVLVALIIILRPNEQVVSEDIAPSLQQDAIIAEDAPPQTIEPTLRPKAP